MAGILLEPMLLSRTDAAQAQWASGLIYPVPASSQIGFLDDPRADSEFLFVARAVEHYDYRGDDPWLDQAMVLGPAGGDDLFGEIGRNIEVKAAIGVGMNMAPLPAQRSRECRCPDWFIEIESDGSGDGNLAFAGGDTGQ